MKIFILAMVGVLMLSGVACSEKQPRLETLMIESKSGKHAFQVEIADEPVKLEIGLMFREHMEPDRGMLFEMGQTGVTRFWMKNTLIPLDMLFIAPDGAIKTIHENAVPKSLDGISSEVPVNAVLELNGGRAKALGIAAGDRVVHPYFKAPSP